VSDKVTWLKPAKDDETVYPYEKNLWNLFFSAFFVLPCILILVGVIRDIKKKKTQ